MGSLVSSKATTKKRYFIGLNGTLFQEGGSMLVVQRCFHESRISWSAVSHLQILSRAFFFGNDPTKRENKLSE